MFSRQLNQKKKQMYIPIADLTLVRDLALDGKKDVTENMMCLMR
jgi:hypothetical protein